jgi:hypothetical protein
VWQVQMKIFSVAAGLASRAAPICGAAWRLAGCRSRS